jgi:hypothetical protein
MCRTPWLVGLPMRAASAGEISVRNAGTQNLKANIVPTSTKVPPTTISAKSKLKQAKNTFLKFAGKARLGNRRFTTDGCGKY